MSDHLGEIVGAYDGDDLEIRQLIERGSLIAELVQHPGWAHYSDYLLSKSASKQRLLVRGHYETLAEYKDVAGWVRGITDALGALEQIQAMIEARIEQATPEPADDDVVPDV